MNLKNLPCGFNAARGFVGGATYMALCMGMAKDLSFNAARGFVGGAANMIKLGTVCLSGFNAARGFVGGAAAKRFAQPSANRQFQCRTRLCGWCSRISLRKHTKSLQFQCRTRLCGWCSEKCRYCSLLACRVSMPHAALWVVQQSRKKSTDSWKSCFNAARGFVGGAASSLSALVPLRGKRPFGKSPEI